MKGIWYCDRNADALKALGMSLEEYLLELFVTIPVFVQINPIEMDWAEVAIEGREEDWGLVTLVMQKFEERKERNMDNYYDSFDCEITCEEVYSDSIYEEG